MKDIKRLEEIGDYQLPNGELIPAEYFLQEPKGSLSLIPYYDDDVDIFEEEEKDCKNCDICGGDMTHHGRKGKGYWE